MMRNVVFLFGLVGCALAETCFETHENMALFGHNVKVIRLLSLEDCKTLCASAVSYTCRSFDYTVSRTCYLSDASHETNPDDYTEHAQSTYGFLTECSEVATEAPDEGDELSGSGSGSGWYDDDEDNDRRRDMVKRFLDSERQVDEGMYRRQSETNKDYQVDLKALINKHRRDRRLGLD